jgi:hypothetical protein
MKVLKPQPITSDQAEANSSENKHHEGKRKEGYLLLIKPNGWENKRSSFTSQSTENRFPSLTEQTTPSY